MSEVAKYNLIESKGDWEIDDVNYSDPPSLFFRVEPPVNIVDQFESQMRMDAFLQSEDLGVKLGQNGKNIAIDMPESYIIKFSGDRLAII